MAVTQEQIARAAGVSRGTVDRVLNQRPNVSETTRKKVLRAAEQLGYQTKRSKQPSSLLRVSMLIPPWSDSYFNRRISSGIRSITRQLNDPLFQVKQCLLKNTTSKELIRVIREETANGTQGFIVRPENIPEVQILLQSITASGIPVVTYDADIPDCGRICFIGQNLHLAGQIAAGLFHKMLQPDQHILIVVGNLCLEAHKGRVDGFCMHLETLGFRTDQYQILETAERYDLTEEFILRELRANPQIRAIYMATQPISACISGIRKAHLPHPIHVICNDLTPAAKKYLEQGRIDFVIGQSFEQESQKAILALYRLLRFQRKPTQDIYYTDFQIISREMLGNHSTSTK